VEFSNRRRTQDFNRSPERAWIPPELGIVLMDSSLKPVAYNHEAITILKYAAGPGIQGEQTFRIPEGLLELIRRHKSGDSLAFFTHFRAGRREYVCQGQSLESCSECLPQPTVVLLLQRNSSAHETVHKLAAQFNLTEREGEALQGLAIGLTSKEVAERMHISPNTVKAFLRLIMVKMGVTTRSAVVAKILEQSPHIGGEPIATEPAPDAGTDA
jgi:DNA-binding CsgD family transcriptional regulator